MSDFNRRGFIGTVFAGLAAPLALSRRRASDHADLPPDLVARVPLDEEVVTYEDGPQRELPAPPSASDARGMKLVACGRVLFDPLRLDAGVGVRHLARAKDRSVYIHYAPGVVPCSIFACPVGDEKNNIALVIFEQSDKYVRVCGVNMMNGEKLPPPVFHFIAFGFA